MDDAHQVRLDSVHFRPGERFIYTFNYYDNWQLEIRLEDRGRLMFSSLRWW